MTGSPDDAALPPDVPTPYFDGGPDPFTPPPVQPIAPAPPPVAPGSAYASTPFPTPAGQGTGLYGPNPYASQYGSPPWPPVWQQQQRPTNGLAIGALIASLCGLITLGAGGIVGIVLSSIALRQIPARGDKGKGLAIAGLVIGIVMSIIFVLLIIGLALGVTTSSGNGHGGGGGGHGGLNHV